jgi:hypothetical protein
MNPSDPITVTRADVEQARVSYAKFRLATGGDDDAAAAAIRRLTAAIGGLQPGDYVLADELTVDLRAVAPSDRWTPVPGMIRVRVTEVGADDLGVPTATVIRPDSHVRTGEAETVKQDDLIWSL